MPGELVLRNITKIYPGVRALNNVSLSFSKGEVHAIIGENGAGKSTLIKIISGSVIPDEGEIEFEGRPVGHMTPVKAIQLGIAVVHQELMQFEDLTVADNICMSDPPSGRLFENRSEKNKAAKKILEGFKAVIEPDTLVRDLSVANRQIVEIAKVIHQKARVVIMDEPTAAITVTEQERLFELIHMLRAEGIIVIYISHRLEELFRICDKVTVLRDGCWVDTQPIERMDTHTMIAKMVGRDIGSIYMEKTPCRENVVLEVENLSGNGVHNISFQLHEGEILGFAGLVGAGRTELMQLIFGAAPVESGNIYLKGKKVSIRTPTEAIKQGIGLITEDRKQTGLFLDKSIRWNTSVITIKRFCRMGLIQNKKDIREAEKYLKMLNIKAPSINTAAASLSGGNQQKVVLAKVLSADSDIIIFDEPTRGVDVGARSEIYQLMVDLTKQNKSILMVTSDMEELLGMSENIVVLHEGSFMGKLAKEEFSQNRVMQLASGISEEVTNEDEK